MNIVYAGYRSWAFDIADGLIKNAKKPYTITGILTTKNPEAPYTNLKADVYPIDPADLNSPENKKILKKLNPDVFLFYGWSWMIPKDIYDEYPCLILHTSPLPKYRGGSPLQNQIIRGEKVSAVSIFQATEGIDEGPIYAQAPFSLEGSMNEIFKQIVTVGLKETKKVLKGLSEKKLIPQPQNEKDMTYFKRRKPKESEIIPDDFKTKTSVELYNLIRALGDPYPNAYIICKDGKKLYLTGAKLEKH